MTYGQTVAHEIAARANGQKETNQPAQVDTHKQGLQYKQQLLKTMGQNNG